MKTGSPPTGAGSWKVEIMTIKAADDILVSVTSLHLLNCDHFNVTML